MRILRPEKNHVKRNQTVWEIWDYTMQRHRKIALERGIALISADANFHVGVKSVLGEDSLYIFYFVNILFIFFL